MAKVKLNDVAIEARETWKQSKTDVPVVGLEHLEPDEIWLKRWDLNPDENTFTKGFKKGQLLFGRRRAYQKKMSVASCDGICSGDITVISAKPEKILADLLPFYLRTDTFFDFAVRGSGGSLSPRVKWSHISDYEFDLPPMEEQKKLAELLWAANDLKEKYKKAMTATDEMLKAKFREMFGEVGNGVDGSRGDAEARREGESGLAAKNAEVAKSKWPVVKLDEVAPSRLGKMLDAKKQTGMHLRPYLANVNVQWFRFDLSNLRQMDFNEDDRREFSLIEGDLLVCEGGEVGRCAIWHNHMPECYFQKAIHRVRCDKNRLLPEYLAWWFKRKSEDGYFNTKGTTIDHLPSEKLKKLEISLPPLSLQREFVAIAEKAEAAKANLKKSIAAIDQVMKGLING